MSQPEKSEGTKFLDCFPVSRTPSTFFCSTDREIYSRVSQMLTGHGCTGEYYKRSKPKESPWCLCTSIVGVAPVAMTCDHILRFKVLTRILVLA